MASAPTEANDPVSKHNSLYSKSLYWDGTKYVSNTASGFAANATPATSNGSSSNTSGEANVTVPN